MTVFARGPLPVNSPAFNGQALLNLGFTDLNGDYPFINAMLNTSIGGTTDTSTTAYPAFLNINGYPITGAGTLPSSYNGQIVVNPYYAGDWIFDWVGTLGGGPALTLTGGTGVTPTVISGGAFVNATGPGSIAFTGTNGFVQFNWGATASFRMGISFNSGATFNATQIRLYRADHASYLAQGGVYQWFSPDFLNLVKSLKPRILRTMEWCTIAMGSNWVSRRPANSMSFDNMQWVPGDWVGDSSATTFTTSFTGSIGPSSSIMTVTTVPSSTIVPGMLITGTGVSSNTLVLPYGTGGTTGTGNNTGTYAVTQSQTVGSETLNGALTNYTCSNGTNHNPSAYVDREIIQIRWQQANTGSATISRGGLAAIQQRGMNGTDQAVTGDIHAGDLSTMQYDANLNAFLGVGGGLATSDGGEVAIEAKVALCNYLNCDLWLNIPTYADDNYVSNACTLIAPILNGKLYIEWSNELWNTPSDYHDWCNTTGLGLGFTGGFLSYQGLRSCQIEAAAASAWTTAGRNRSDLKIVIADQNHPIAAGGSDPTFLYLCAGSDLSATGHNVAPNRPLDLCDVFSMAPYQGGIDVGQFQGDFTSLAQVNAIRAAADNYNLGTPAGIAASRAFFDNDARDPTMIVQPDGTLDTNISNLFPSYASYVSSTNWSGTPKKFVCYEGSYAGIAPTVSTLLALGYNTTDANTYGGTHDVGPPGLMQLALDDWKSSPLFKQFIFDYLNAMYSLGVIPPWFVFCQGNNSWSMFKGDIYNGAYESYDGFKKFSGGQ